MSELNASFKRYIRAIDEIRPYLDELSDAGAVCEWIFKDKHEAFLAGLALGDVDPPDAGCAEHSDVP